MLPVFGVNVPPWPVVCNSFVMPWVKIWARRGEVLLVRKMESCLDQEMVQQTVEMMGNCELSGEKRKRFLVGVCMWVFQWMFLVGVGMWMFQWMFLVKVE